MDSDPRCLPLDIHTPEDTRVERARRDDANELITDFTCSAQISGVDDSHAHALTNRPESSDLEKIASTEIASAFFELRPVDGRLIPSIASQKSDSRLKATITEDEPELARAKINEASSCERRINERSNISSASDPTQRQNHGTEFQDRSTESKESNVESESPIINKNALALSTKLEWPLVEDILRPDALVRQTVPFATVVRTVRKRYLEPIRPRLWRKHHYVGRHWFG